MGEDSSKDETQKQPSRVVRFYKSKIFAIFISVVLTTMLSLVLFWYYQSISTYACLQGFWHIGGNSYILIDSGLLRVIELTNEESYKTIFEDSDSILRYRSVMPVLSHDYTIELSSSISQFGSNPFKSTILFMKLFSPSGVIEMTTDAGETYRLTKDCGMSSEYLS